MIRNRNIEVFITIVKSFVLKDGLLPPDVAPPLRPPRGCVLHRAHLPVPVRGGGCAKAAEVADVLVPPAQGGDSIADWNLGCSRSGCELRTSLGDYFSIRAPQNQTCLLTPT